MTRLTAKNSWKVLGLRAKLTVPLALLAIVAAITCTFSLRDIETRRVERELTSFCRAIAESVAVMAELTDDRQVLQRFVSNAAFGPGVKEILVASGEPLTIIAASRRDWIGQRAADLPNPEHYLEGLESVVATHNPSTDVEHGNLDLVGYTLPIHTAIGARDSRNLAPGAVMVHLDHHPTRDAARTTTIALVVGMLTTVAGGVIWSYALLKSLVLEPVAAIGKVVDSRAAGDVTARIRSDCPDELGQLAGQFDDMLDALASSHAELIRERDVQQQLARELNEYNTELIEKRNALEEAEAKFRSLVNNIPGVSYRCLMDGAWSMLFISDAVRELTGYPPDEFLNNTVRTFESVIHGEDRAMVAREITAAVVRRKSYTLEYRIVHATGEVRWVREKGQAVFIAAIEPEPAYLDGAIFDITDRKRTEQTLRDAMQQLESHKFAIDEHAIVAVTDPRGTITYANDRFCEISGYTREELIGQDHRLINSGQHSQSFWRDMWRTISRGDVWHGEVCNRAKSGELYWVDATIVPFKDVSGRITQYIAIRTDITQIKEIQRELEAKSRELSQAWEKAETASNAKSEFLANMSHEIRTPLTAMLGYADLLGDTAEVDESSLRRRQTVATIKRAGEHLLTVVNDILDVSKVDAGKMTVERIETDLPELFQGVGSLLRPRAEDKGLTLDMQLESPIPTRVLSDPTRLRQVLMNLIGNAIKFTESGGVRLGIAIEHQAVGMLLRVAVIDTGSGLTQEQAAQLFKAFSQADSSVTRKHGGTGLGLVLCRRLTGLMGGNVELSCTEPGRGSTFTATFRVESVPDAAMVTNLSQVRTEFTAFAPEKNVALHGRILLAEDGPDNQRLIAFILKKAGARVEVAENGKIALQMLGQAEVEDQPYDLLLTDMQMPKMDGYTLTRRLRDQGSKIAIVALTAHAMPEDRRKCLAAGCNDYTTKPIEKGNLLATCSRWLTRQECFRAASPPG